MQPIRNSVCVFNMLFYENKNSADHNVKEKGFAWKVYSVINHQNGDLKLFTLFTKSVVRLFNSHTNTKLWLAQSHSCPFNMKEQWILKNISTFCMCKQIKIYSILGLYSLKSMSIQSIESNRTD